MGLYADRAILELFSAFIVNADHSIMWSAAMTRIADRVRDGVRFAIPQATEWQHIGNQINAAMIATRADFVGMRFAIRPQMSMPSNG